MEVEHHSTIALINNKEKMVSIQRGGTFDVGVASDMSHRRRCSNSLTEQIIPVRRISAITVSLCTSCLLLLVLSSSSCTEAFQTSNNINPKPRILRPDNSNNNNMYCNDHHAVSSSSSMTQYHFSTTKLYNLFPKDEFDKDPFLDDDDDDDDIYLKYDPAVAAQLRKAKQLIKDAKKKQKAKDESFLDTEVTTTTETTDKSKDGEAKSSGLLPFFAAKHNKIKSKTKSGEIIADGDEMATLSKSEPWERRSLSQMFVKEKGTDWDGNVIDKDDGDFDKSVIMDKDVARSIYNLRKSMQTEDFRRVFDPRNRFIGEVD